jgi:NAD(P)-dependent dehydrogenase (short-subunit alcohol dehydrogenase family)
MKIIVITGSTRGIGLGLADAFLARNCAVVINGRTTASVDGAVEQLAANYDRERILAHPGDVTDFDQVQALWDAARAHFGHVDVWINSAGLAHAQTDFWQHDPAEIEAVVRTNTIGAMYGARVAIAGMLDQGFGAFYNMEGLGSDGRQVEGLALYGSTKYALSYLTDALVDQTRGSGLVVGALRPGMVLTDLLIGQRSRDAGDWERAKKVFNLLADHVETVTPWLADQVLANERTGVRIKWLTTWRLIGRVLAAPFRRRDLFEEE